MRIWLVHCRLCGRATTGANPPGHPQFSKDVECVKCGSLIDAGEGKFLIAELAGKKEKVDLLKVL